MNTFLALTKVESKKAANWFRDNTLTKLFVIFGFLMVILGIIFAEHKIASIYLSFAADYAPFGPAMAIYSLKVAVFLLFILAVISSTVLSSSTLYQNSTLSHLFTLPIRPISIFISKVLPGWITSTLILLLLVPLFLIYNQYIFKSDNFIVVVSLGLLILSVVSQSLGIIISTFIAKFVGRITRRKQFLILISLIIAFIVLLKLLFPSNLFHLYDAPNFSSFQYQLDRFPLMGKLLPTNWLIDSLAGNFNFISIFTSFLTVLILLIIIKIIGYKYYPIAWRRAQNQSYLAGNNNVDRKSNSTFPKISFSKNIYGPLIINDFLSLIRSNAEVNYGLFLGSLLVILIFSINNLANLKDTTHSLLLAIYLIAYISVVLIFLIFSIRSIFPLMAREKYSSWFSFSLPLSRQKYLIEKLLFSMLLSLPVILIASLIAYGLKLPLNQLFVFVSLTFAMVLMNNLLQCLFGAINPNFREANHPDAVSTNSMGVFALVVSLFIIVITTIQLNNYFHGFITGLGFALRWIFMAAIIIAPTFLFALKSIKKYSL